MNNQTSVNQFKKELQMWVQETGQDLVEDVKKTAAAIQTEVVQRTRIKTGRAKSNWHIEVGGPNWDVDPSIDDLDPKTWLSAQQALTVAQQEVSNLNYLTMNDQDLYDIYISSGVHYILTLEDKDAMAEGTVHWAVSFLPVIITGQVERG